MLRQNVNLQKLLQTGMDAFSEGDYEKAREYWTKASALAPNHIRVKAYLHMIPRDSVEVIPTTHELLEPQLSAFSPRHTPESPRATHPVRRPFVKELAKLLPSQKDVQTSPSREVSLQSRDHISRHNLTSLSALPESLDFEAHVEPKESDEESLPKHSDDIQTSHRGHKLLSLDEGNTANVESEQLSPLGLPSPRPLPASGQPRTAPKPQPDRTTTLLRPPALIEKVEKLLPCPNHDDAIDSNDTVDIPKQTELPSYGMSAMRGEPEKLGPSTDKEHA